MKDAVFWLALVSPVILGICAGMLPSYLSHRRKELLLRNAHSERMMALEKGLPVPEMPADLIDLDTPTATNSMRSGLALTLVGIVLYFAVGRFMDEDMALFGLIPTAVGIANLVYAAVLWRREKALPPSA
jgi:hypothetical protein